MLKLCLGANTVLNGNFCNIKISQSSQTVGQEIGFVWLVLDKARKALISPAYLHESKDWASFDKLHQTWQLDLLKLFDTHQAHSVQCIAYAYDTTNLTLPAVEINHISLTINDEICYDFVCQQRHIKTSIILEIYQREGQYKLRALADNSTQFLGYFAQNLQISLDTRHPTIHEQIQNDLPSPAHNHRPQAGEIWTGTAFAIDEYHLLTCHHVIDGATMIGIRQEGFTDREAQVVISDDGSDTAILKVSEPLPYFLPIRTLSYDLLGENVVTLGFPLSGVTSQLQVTQGNIAGLRGIGGDIRYLQFTAPIQAGSSGSPLLIPTGEVIGMVTHTIQNTQNMNYATKSQLLLALLASCGLTLNEKPLNNTNLTTPQLTKNSRQALWLVGCQA